MKQYIPREAKREIKNLNEAEEINKHRVIEFKTNKTEAKKKILNNFWRKL